MAQPTNKAFDRRVFDRYLDKKIISQDEFKAHMKGLPDEADNATYVQMDIHDTELGEGDHADSDSHDEDT